MLCFIKTFKREIWGIPRTNQFCDTNMLASQFKYRLGIRREAEQEETTEPPAKKIKIEQLTAEEVNKLPNVPLASIHVHCHQPLVGLSYNPLVGVCSFSSAAQQHSK